MLTNFKIQANLIDSDFEVHSDDIFYFLNQAQEVFVKSRFSGNNELGSGFGQGIEVTEDIRPLFKANTALTPYHVSTIVTPDNIAVDRANIPSDYMFGISLLANITYTEDASGIEVNTVPDPDVRQVVGGTANATKSVRVVPVQSDDLYSLLEDPFNKPSLSRVLVDLNETYFDFYTETRAFISSAVLNYIKEPLEIKFIADGDGNNQDSELPTHTHDDIVTLAVKMFLESRSITQQ